MRSCMEARVSTGDVKVVACVPRSVAAGVLPAVTAAADVMQSNARVGHHDETATPRALGECEIFAEVPVAGAIARDERQEVWDDGASETLVASGKLLAFAHRRVHAAVRQQKPRC